MKFLKLFFVLIVVPFILGWTSNKTDCKNSVYILDKVRKKYDGQNKWGETELKIHIQEPRVGNPLRHTKLNLQNSNDYFEMERYREDGVVKRILTGDGDSKIFLNNESNLTNDIIEQYRLSKERSIGHKKFYKLMYGLPMSITDEIWSRVEPAINDEFNGIEVYKVAMELKDEMISKHWTLVINAENYQLLAVEFNHPNEPGKEEEIIKFEGEFENNGVILPRIRNWYIKQTNEYLGTDVIVSEIN